MRAEKMDKSAVLGADGGKRCRSYGKSRQRASRVTSCPSLSQEEREENSGWGEWGRQQDQGKGGSCAVQMGTGAFNKEEGA